MVWDAGQPGGEASGVIITEVDDASSPVTPSSGTPNSVNRIINFRYTQRHHPTRSGDRLFRLLLNNVRAFLASLRSYCLSAGYEWHP